MPGHIGDKCFQDVSFLVSSLSGPAVSMQPSWAHVVCFAHLFTLNLLPSPSSSCRWCAICTINCQALVLARSTLLRTLAPVEKPFSGKVVFEDVVLRCDGEDPAVEQAAGVDANQQEVPTDWFDVNIKEQKNAKFDKKNESLECVDENESMEVQTSLNSEAKLVRSVSSQAVQSSENIMTKRRKPKKMEIIQTYLIPKKFSQSSSGCSTTSRLGKSRNLLLLSFA